MEPISDPVSGLTMYAGSEPIIVPGKTRPGGGTKESPKAQKPAKKKSGSKTVAKKKTTKKKK